MSESETENMGQNELTDRQPYRGSPVAGYMRSAKWNDPRMAKWEAGIRTYAAERGYNLTALVREEGVSGVAIWKPKLQQLIADTLDRKYIGIIAPSVQHLHIRASNSARIIAQISVTDAWISFLIT